MKVFVSYAEEDSVYAQALSEALARRGIEVLLGKSITPGASWVTSLQRMLEEADAFVLIASKASMTSQWVSHEIAAAVARSSRDRSVRLLPVALDRRAEISPLLSRYQSIGPPTSRDPNRVAEMIVESLGQNIPPADLNLERKVIEAEQETLDALMASRESSVQWASSYLGWILSVVGLVAGVIGTVTLIASTDSSSGIDVVQAIATTTAFVLSSIAVFLSLSGRSRK
ncbi:toll/interleukin-1 receptor domain-containing protein [Nocardia takedensis]|uniref:toll/interleukin-1 receptor domain-containing protein n=1 Tax=Nocardia takedensis TaxID=259390 RepID=UPI003F75CBB9